MNRIATVVSNSIQLKNLINEILKDCLKEIALEAGKELQQYVQKEWYEAHSPEMYKRTYQLLNSITNTDIRQKGSGFEIEVGFDKSSIIPNFLGGDLWNEHMSFNGEPFVSGLIETIEEGNLSPYSPPYARNGIHMLENTAFWLAQNLPRIAKKVFAKYGMYLIYNI